MAIYRHIHINYWQDGFVLDLTPEERYFYIYLMTNSKTSQCGIYELPKRIIETETGYNRETVDKLIKRFVEYKKIVYMEETKEIFLKNWVKHNKQSSPKVKKCIEKELTKIKSKELINMFLKECEKYGYTIDTNHLSAIEDIVIGELPTIKNMDSSKIITTKDRDSSEISTTKDFNISEDYNNVSKFKILYEQNVGLINSIVGQWLIEISESVDYDLFKKALEIATDKGKISKGYINGILNQWRDNNIRSLSDLNAYEISLKNRGEFNERNNYEYRKSKHATEFEKEDENIYRKPTEEELKSLERELGT